MSVLGICASHRKSGSSYHLLEEVMKGIVTCAYVDPFIKAMEHAKTLGRAIVKSLKKRNNP